MPRSPLITQAVNDLAKYFNTTTEASFIDQTWGINAVAGNVDVRKAAVKTTEPETQIVANQQVTRAALEHPAGTPASVLVAELLNGALCVGKYLSSVESATESSATKQIKLYTPKNDGGSNKVTIEEVTTSSPALTDAPSRDFDPNGTDGNQHPRVNLYAANVFNPFMGPTTRDIGALEIFMNAMPTLELSKCVPYMSIDIISLLQTAGTTAPPLTLIGFLNPPKQGSADASMLAGASEKVSSEAGELGSGLRSGIELFTAPQTLLNLGETGPTFVPIIDRMRPLATLGNLSLSTKVQGGTLSFTTGRLEITIHDRSRLREVATFIRPDLYGTTFLDITYGWSHPEGGLNSKNAYGKFLDALKTSTRFRIAGSTYSFEEAGQVKVTLNIQTVGSTDLLYLNPKGTAGPFKELGKVIRHLNQLLAERRSRFPAPSMAEYDFLSALQDPSSALAASLDKDVIQKARKLIDTLGLGDEIAKVLGELVGLNLTDDSDSAGNGSKIDTLQKELQSSYDEIIDKIPDYGAEKSDSDFGSSMSDDHFGRMLDTNVSYIHPDTGAAVQTTITAGQKTGAFDRGVTGNDAKKTVGTTNRSDFHSYGAIFMNMIAAPIKESGQYDEVQVIFYPFNKYAGAVHDLPISAFPVEKARFKKAIDDLAKRTPSISCRQIIGLLQDRFTGFAPARAYLMAGFYNQSKANEGTVEDNNLRAKIPITVHKRDKNGNQLAATETKNVSVSKQATFERRLEDIGIPERRFVMPQVQVAVEGAPLVDNRGEPIRDSKGNPKTIIKIHVYDAAMDPHSTISDIVRAAKDNELSVITLPIADILSSTGRDAEALREANDKKRESVSKVIAAGKKLGILKEINLNQNDAPAPAATIFDDMMNRNSYYEVVGGYDGIKSLVMAGMPYLTYGSSTSAITNATLSSNTSAGLGNVQLLRAFMEPGETQAENLDSSVPMLVVPGQLSISTFGCPLFSPMQRLFIDFGTGTSIDNVYYVISSDTTIGKDGFKTDVKLAFADAFAQYRSLDQNLALLSHLAKAGTSGTPGAATPVTTNAALSQGPDTDPQKKIDDLRKFVRQGIISAGMPAVQLEANEKAKLERKLQLAQAKVQAKASAEAAKVQAAAESIVPQEVKDKIAQAQAKIAMTGIELQAKAEPAVRAALLAKQVTDIIALADALPPDVAAAVIGEALTAIADMQKQAAANASSQP